MSHKLENRTVKAMVQGPGTRVEERSLILGTVHTVETTLTTDSETGCESPLCDVRFPQTGLKIEPRRFCCGECRQEASLIRRVAKLLERLTDDEKLKALRSR
jgi:hypothetical protein